MGAGCCKSPEEVRVEFHKANREETVLCGGKMDKWIKIVNKTKNKVVVKVTSEASDHVQCVDVRAEEETRCYNIPENGVFVDVFAQTKSKRESNYDIWRWIITKRGVDVRGTVNIHQIHINECFRDEEYYSPYDRVLRKRTGEGRKQERGQFIKRNSNVFLNKGYALVEDPPDRNSFSREGALNLNYWSLHGRVAESGMMAATASGEDDINVGLVDRVISGESTENKKFPPSVADISGELTRDQETLSEESVPDNLMEESNVPKSTEHSVDDLVQKTSPKESEKNFDGEKPFSKVIDQTKELPVTEEVEAHAPMRMMSGVFSNSDNDWS